VRIYLDHNATTPPSDAVIQRMTATLRDEFGNPSSVHHFGQRAKAALDEARAAVAALLGADPSEIVFTSGGTEGANMAIRGVAEALVPTGRRHLVTTAIEHEAVLNTVKALGKRGWSTSIVGVDQTGVVDPDAVAAAMTDQTALVSTMHANNEIGTIQPVAAVAAIAKARGAVTHTDAVQSAGKLPIAVKALGVDLLSISAHKFYGPKGVGAIWIRRGVRLTSVLTGGKHERSRRAGTENVIGIIGMGVAATLAARHLEESVVRLATLRDRLESGVLRSVTGTTVNGALSPRVANTTNISFDRTEAESLLIALDLQGIAVSTGSACSSGTLEPSHVLRAMGLSAHRTQNSIRFSLGAGNTGEQVDALLAKLPAVVSKLRTLVRR
jgi:cysteine desulfurase